MTKKNASISAPPRPRSRATPQATSRVSVLAGLLAVAFSTNVVAGNSMRCGSRIISEGTHAAKVLRYCGDPAVSQARRALGVYSRGRGIGYYPGLTEEIWIEEWTYNLGPNKLMRVIRLENGVVTDIRHLGYGYNSR